MKWTRRQLSTQVRRYVERRAAAPCAGDEAELRRLRAAAAECNAKCEEAKKQLVDAMLGSGHGIGEALSQAALSQAALSQAALSQAAGAAPDREGERIQRPQQEASRVYNLGNNLGEARAELERLREKRSVASSEHRRVARELAHIRWKLGHFKLVVRSPTDDGSGSEQVEGGGGL